MANGFGSLQVGASGLRSAQNALNVVANNLANVDTKGYVRQQVVFEDMNYQQYDLAASISKQKSGLGVGIADVIHSRDVFLDRQYRTANGREAFYATSYETTQQVETLLREGDGRAFSDTIHDLFEAMSEFSKDPSDAANQSVLSQTVSLFLKQSQAIYDDLKDYQTNLNAQVRDNVAEVNKLSKTIYELNLKIMAVEAADVETAMEMRDARDNALDALSKLANIEYSENADGVVRVKLEGTDLVTEARAYTLDTYKDGQTGFVTPFWPYLSDIQKEKYYDVFRVDNIDATKNNDIGKIKSLILARGNTYANYTSIDTLTEDQYNSYIGQSTMMNTEAELDMLVHSMMIAINDIFSPLTTYNDTVTATDKNGNPIELTPETRVLDKENCYVGVDGTLPPAEIFSRNVVSRFEEVYVANPDGTQSVVYLYNEEDPSDYSTLYTLGNVSINQVIIQDQSQIPHKQQNGNIAYDLGEKINVIWDENKYHLNPSDKTPCTFSDYYTKMIGELANNGSVYRTKAETLDRSVATIDSSRQEVIGVSSDEELTHMIRFQNAYNASSRYMSVISQMIEHLLTSLGR